jgi:MSHA biogenesis protein MshM
MTTLYLDHFGLGEAPFSITPNPHFFFAGCNRGSMLEALRYAVQADEGIVTVIGEVGSGKTMLCRMLLEHLPPQVDAIYLANPSFSRNEILDAIAHDLGLSADADSAPTRLDALNRELIARYAAGRRVVLLIDEAHAMPAESLEEVRLLSNLETSRHKLLNIVLFGQPELAALLARPALRQLRERVVQRFELGPLPASDVRDYLEFRLRAAGHRGSFPFTAKAVARIGRTTGGLTRRINILADKALLSCFARDGTQVDVQDVARAERDVAFAPARAPSPRWPASALAAAIALVAGTVAFAAGLAVGRQAPDAPSAQAPAPRAGRAVAAAAPANAAPRAVAAVPTDPLREAEAAYAHWLERDAEGYTLQVAALRADDQAARRELARIAAALPGLPLRAHRDATGRASTLVLYAGEFASADEARRALALLPPTLRANRPVLRSLGALRTQTVSRT